MPSVALVSALLFALSTSMWVDASLAELHTMTMALTFAGILFALRFHRRVVWRARKAIETDYSVAVHLVSHDPPAGPADILAQADAAHPVGGWYPTSRWAAGEVVRGTYVLDVPRDAEPVAVRIGMYRVVADGQFDNTDWLSLPVPEK